jgi:uncharacterized protein
MARTYALRILGGEYAVCRLAPHERLPSWATGAFCSFTRTADELSVVCPASTVPESVPCARGWKLMKYEENLDFSEVGVLSSVAEPLAHAGISILTIGTYLTDYILIREAHLDRAKAVLSLAGHLILAD